jgi:hypothetical protein
MRVVVVVVLTKEAGRQPQAQGVLVVAEMVGIRGI